MTRIRGDCSKETFRAGQAFIDEPGQLMRADNGGKQPAVLFFTFVLPRGAELSTKREPPANCPGA